MTNLPTAAAKSLQSCQTLYDPTDGSPPGSPIPGILQNIQLEKLKIFKENGCGISWKLLIEGRKLASKSLKESYNYLIVYW